MTNTAHNPRPTIGVLAGWQFYEGNVNGFLDLVLRGIRSAAQEQNCNLLFACGLGHAIGPIRFCPAWPVASSETDFVPVGPWNTDGLVVINPLLSTERVSYIQQIRKEGHPVVFVGSGEEKQAVSPDNESGIKQAIAHLVQHGYRRIAFVAGHPGDEDQDSIKRLLAFQSAIREYGLDSDPALIAYGSHNFHGGRLAMKQLLDSGIPFRAVVASNDNSAFGAAWEIRENKLRIPEDIAIIGFDDIPEAAGQEPPLTTVHYPSFNAGRKALTLLLDTIQGYSNGDEIVPVPVQLVVRESCGCQPGNSIMPACAPQADARMDAKSKLIQSILEVVRTEIIYLNLDEIKILCERLVDAFIRSLHENDPAIFRIVFLEILQRLEESEGDPTIWHSALLLLEQNSQELMGTQDKPSEKSIEAMLNQARVAISTSLQKQKVQYITARGNIADQIGLLTSNLFTAVDNSQIFEMLREFLPKVGIGRADIGFYEAESEDQMAWSQLYSTSNLPAGKIRFRSREFPPLNLYPPEKPFGQSLFPLIDQGNVDGFIAFDTLDLATCVTIVRQLTAAFRSVRLYREAVESRRLAEEGRKLAEEANYIKSRFLSTVSHELRTPLNLIVGLSNLVLQEDETPEAPALPPSRRRDLEQIHTNAEHLGRLIRDVLDLATSQAGQLRLELEPLDLQETLQAAIEAGEELARQKGLEWKVSAPGRPQMVMGDRTRLRQVLLNLISNAVKFTEHGRVAVQIEVSGGEVLVSVRDTGLGIAAGEQGIIFDEFRQSERTTARGYGGMGLGLAISRRLVELHGGRIWVQSSGQEGSGSTFHFTLPVIQQPQEDEISSLDKGRFVALLVEERSKEGEPLESHLASQGFQVKTFQVDEFSWMTQLLTTPPGAVILDASLAPKRGWEIIRALKGNPATQDVPVIFYSLTHDQGSILEIDYLTKPVGPSDLVHALARQGLEAGADNRDKTILIADDEPGILEMNARIVQAQLPACRVLQARNGREALEVIHQQRPDLVLLDLMMPELDGFGVLKAMREGENTRDIPVIVLTGQTLTEEDMARLNQGVAAVLQKEIFNAQETLAHIKAALARVHQLGSEMQNIIRKAMAYIQDHYSESFSRKEIARYVGVSERYLTRCFHQELGITPVEYLNRYRMKQAKAMLESGESVTVTALETGFSSVSYFTKFFQKEVGMLPSAYRQAHIQK